MSTEVYLLHMPESVPDCNRPGTQERAPQRAPRFHESHAISIADNQQQAHSYHVSPWCASASKRAFDLACVIPALVILSPVLCIVAIAVRLTSPGPIIFRQQRAGRHRKLFTIYKFRTMLANSETTGPGLTATGDPRIIRIGHFLRHFKLDELPQLYNVLRGDMSLVGPRPKLPHLELTSVPCRPGVTGAATLLFRKEQHILREVPEDQVGNFYAQYIAPEKVKLDSAYMSSASFWSDISVLRATVAGGGQHVTRENLVMRTSGLTETPIAVEGN